MKSSSSLLAVTIAASTLAVIANPQSIALAAGSERSCTDPVAVEEVATGSLSDVIAANPELSTFGELIDAAGLTETLHSAQSFNVFAPTNAAFDLMPANVLESVLADAELVTSIAEYHIVRGDGLSSAALAVSRSGVAENGATLTFAESGGQVMVNGGQASICGEIVAANGVVHVIDGVLQPLGDDPSGSSSIPVSSVAAALSAEEEAVATAFESAVDSSLTYDEQAPFIEDAAALRETIENYPAAADFVLGISADVTRVDIDGDTAVIAYIVSFNGVDAGYGELDGTMVNIDDHWVVPREKYCEFQAQARNNCPE